jgi:hypothetical protein
VFIVSIALFLAAILLFAGFLISVSSLVMAQQTTTGPGTTSPLLPPPSSFSSSSPPLTPQEQEQLNRLQNVIAATNLNLDETEKQIGGVVYTPRWSDPVWIEPDSAAVLVAYCLPGEFAESGQEILGGGGGFELEVLESYEVALPQNFTAWMMVIGNEDRQNRYPAAVGVICVSDANNVETRVVSPQEQQQINNVVQQFRTTTSIDQVINVINRNNATTPLPSPPPQNGNTTTPTTPPGGTSSSDVGGITISALDIEFLPSDLTGVDVRAEVSGNTYNGPCPIDASFSGTITDNVGNRDVTYRFIYGENFSTAATAPQQTIHFDQPGSQTVTYTTSGLTPPSLNGRFAIEILEPVQPLSNRADFTITCSSGGGIAVRATSITPPPIYEGPCPPSPFTFNGEINDSIGGRDITYRWRGTDGYTGPVTIHFDNPGTQQVPLEWETLQRSNTTIVFWLEIMSPIQLESNILTWEQKCTTTPSTGGAPPALQTLQAENDTTTAATDDDDEDDTLDATAPTDGGGGGGGGTTTEGGGGTTTEGGGGTTTEGGGGGDASDTDNGD